MLGLSESTDRESSVSRSVGGVVETPFRLRLRVDIEVVIGENPGASQTTIVGLMGG
jgi:hypothetical protein